MVAHRIPVPGVMGSIPIALSFFFGFGKDFFVQLGQTNMDKHGQI